MFGTAGEKALIPGWRVKPEANGVKTALSGLSLGNATKIF